MRMGQNSTQLLSLPNRSLICAVAVHNAGWFILMIKEVILRGAVGSGFTSPSVWQRYAA